MSTPDSSTPRPSPASRDRAEQTRLLDDFLDAHTPQRVFARDHDLPRSTLQHWLCRGRRSGLDPDAARFFDRPAGLAFLHRLVTALHLVFCLQGPCGLRLLGPFLRLTHLDRVVPASFGARQRFARVLEQAVIDFAAAQRQTLAAGMPPKAIAVAEDETFHPQTCLVALEPDSGFLLVEQYAPRRDAATWNQALQAGLDGLPVTVAVAVGDEAKGLLAHARDGLGVPHAPDLFHVQRDLSRGLGPSLAAQTRQAEGWVEAAGERLQRARAAQEAAAQRPRPPGRPPDHAGRVELAEQLQAGYQRYQAACVDRQEQFRAALRGLGDDDHPFDLASGQPRQAAAVRQALEGRLAAVEQLAAQTRLSAKVAPHLARARRLLPELVAVVALFWLRLRAAVAQHYGAAAEGWAVPLVAGLYLRRAAGRGRDAEERQRWRTQAEQCLAAARRQGEPAGGWPEAERRCQEWSGWFARSTSAVEGRNGQLSLRHHSLHRLGTRKLAALTAVHNYWLKRPDGTTAAERFFGQKPADLFEWLLQRLPVPGRPARRRAKAA